MDRPNVVVLFADQMANAFFNSLLITIPSTVIPITMAAFAAHAIAWMVFPGRKVLFVIIVGLLIVPLQMALIPVLRVYTRHGINGTYLGMWLAHTGFGLPLATYMLYGYISSIPKSILESAHADGAHTGEVSAAMLADVGTRLVVVGHSERRADHGETDAVVRAKAATVIGSGMVPVVCVGEVETERAAGRHEDVVVGQLRGSLAKLTVTQADQLVVAYEPVWAIGTGRTATADDAQTMCALVRQVLHEQFGTVGDDVRVLYGGSVKPGNAAELFARGDIDGGLVGGASLERASYLAIARAAAGRG